MRSRIGRRILAGYLAVSLLLAALLAGAAYAGAWIAQVTRRVDQASRTAGQVLTALSLVERRLFLLLLHAADPESRADGEEHVLGPVLASQLTRLADQATLQEGGQTQADLRSAVLAYEEAARGFLRRAPGDRLQELSELLTRHEQLRERLEGMRRRVQEAAGVGAAQLEALQGAGWLPGFLRNLARNSQRARHLSQAVLSTLEFESRLWRRLSAALAARLDPRNPEPPRGLAQDLQLLRRAERLAAVPEVQALTTALRARLRALEDLTPSTGSPQALRALGREAAQATQQLEALRALLEVERDRALAEVRLVQDSVVSFVQTFSAAAVVALLAGFVALLALTRAMTASLETLREAMDRVREGRLDVRVEVGRRRDETAEMARVFNRMVAELQESREKLQVYQAELQRLVQERTRALEEAQAQLLQAEKLSAVGELVAGVAHELNNPLTSVLGYGQLLESDPTLPQELRSYAEIVVREADRARHIVQSLLTFARPQAVEREVLDLNGVVQRTLEAARWDPGRIEVTLRPYPEPLWVRGNPVQLQQVFTNIVQNALQAMREGPGELVVTTQRAGDQAVVEFADTGPGISPEHLNRVFDPFFTTKKLGEGTGLGLSIAYGIVRDHGGAIRVRNRPGGGACFAVDLPVCEPPALTDPRPAPPPEPPRGPAP